jgi:hypothetical protein
VKEGYLGKRRAAARFVASRAVALVDVRALVRAARWGWCVCCCCCCRCCCCGGIGGGGTGDRRQGRWRRFAIAAAAAAAEIVVRIISPSTPVAPSSSSVRGSFGGRLVVVVVVFFFFEDVETATSDGNLTNGTRSSPRQRGAFLRDTVCVPAHAHPEPSLFFRRPRRDFQGTTVHTLLSCLSNREASY